MKVSRQQLGQRLELAELRAGDVFQYQRRTYLVTRWTDSTQPAVLQAVDLRTGNVQKFALALKVTHVNARVVIT